MACFHPLKAFQLESGEVVFSERGRVFRSLELPCGQCIGCRLERSRQWAVRCMHESQMHENSSFITLTYSDELLESPSLQYRDYQLFMKRLRKKYPQCRFYMCGEYGEDFQRPHFHACIFGVYFADRKFFRRLPSGSNIYTSNELDSLWGKGFASVGDVTFESAAYIARYCMKKVTGDAAAKHYECVVAETGEIVQRVPEFNKMSLKPGIGATWLEKFGSEVYPRDYVVVNGVKAKPPRYYDQRAEDVAKFEIEYVQMLRLEKAHASVDNTPDRLAVREKCVNARLQFKKRSVL